MVNNEEKIYLLKVGEEEPCSHCKWEDAVSRAEAVKRMAKAMRQAKFPKTKRIPNWEELDADYQAEYLRQAEAALDALLDKGDARKGNN